MPRSVEDFFAPGGLIATVKPDFIPREGQADFSAMIVQAIADRKDVIAEAPTGFGKCLTGSTLYTLADGSRVEVQNLPKKTPLASLSWTEKDGYSTQQAVVWQDSMQECFRIETLAGRHLEVSAEHPCWTEAGWGRAANLQPGQHLGVARAQPHGSIDYDVDRAWLIGLLIGDGGLTASVSVTIQEPDTLRQAQERCARLGYALNRRPSAKYGYGVVVSAGRYSPLKAELVRLGLWGHKSESKRIPAECFRWSAKSVAALLDGYFAADGGAECSIEYDSVSRGLLEDVQSLLLRFGVVSWLRLKNGTYKGVRHLSWRLIIASTSTPTFMSNIMGDTSRTKKARGLAERTHNGNLDVTPQCLIDRLSPGRPSGNFLRRHTTHDISYRRRVGHNRDRVQEFAQAYGYDCLAHNANLCWDKIVKVESIGMQQTYSVAVDNTHTHVTNDFVTHNSFSVLVPAILAAMEGKRVVISTETLTLQDQYARQDIPLLQQACAAAGIHFTSAVAKGRTNYICRGKVDEDKFVGASPLMAWAKTQQGGSDTGDLSSVPFEFDSQEWRTLCADEDCESNACPFYGKGRKGESDCFVYQATCRFLEAQIVVANHTLVLLDVARGAGSILGAYDVLIIDEAHVFAEKAQDTWGTTLKPHTISNSIKVLNRMLEKVNVHYFEHGYLDRYRDLEGRMFAPFKSVLGQSITLKQLPPDVVEASKRHSQALVDDLRRANKELSDYIVKDEFNPTTTIIRTAKEKLSKLISDLNAIYGDTIDDAYKDNWLVFLGTGWNAQRKPYGILNLKPIDVAPLMRSLVFDVVPTTVFMSATMRIGPSFSFMRRELGIPTDTLEFIGGSPFNFEDNVTGYFPTHLPESREGNYLQCLAAEVQEVLEHSKGKALVLFTNNKDMHYCYEQVSTRVDHRCFVQGQASKPVLIDMFKDDITSCLFATRSFFTGIDIPGEALSCVILTKAPFQVPTDPMFKAKADKIDDAGGSSFGMLSMPLMLFDVRQAFGRLIRTTTDTGLFAFLDSRAMKKAYGKQIIKALPGIRITDRLGDRGRPADLAKPYAPSRAASRKTAALEAD